MRITAQRTSIHPGTVLINAAFDLIDETHLRICPVFSCLKRMPNVLEPLAWCVPVRAMLPCWLVLAFQELSKHFLSVKSPIFEWPEKKGTINGMSFSCLAIRNCSEGGKKKKKKEMPKRPIFFLVKIQMPEGK